MMRFTFPVGVVFLCLYAYGLTVVLLPWLFPPPSIYIHQLMVSVLDIFPRFLYQAFSLRDAPILRWEIPIPSFLHSRASYLILGFSLLMALQGFVYGAVIDLLLGVIARSARQGFPVAPIVIGAIFLYAASLYHHALSALFPGTSNTTYSSSSDNSADSSSSNATPSSDSSTPPPDLAPAVSPTPDSSSPSSSTSETPEQQIADTITAFIGAANSSTNGDQSAFYADTVNYYSNGTKDLDYIRSTISDFNAQWPNRVYTLRGDITSVNNGTTYRTTCQVDFNISNDQTQTNAHGTDSFTFDVQNINSVWKIVGIQVETLNPTPATGQ